MQGWFRYCTREGVEDGGPVSKEIVVVPQRNPFRTDLQDKNSCTDPVRGCSGQSGEAGNWTVGKSRPSGVR
jgi:hypothetical protein